MKLNKLLTQRSDLSISTLCDPPGIELSNVVSENQHQHRRVSCQPSRAIIENVAPDAKGFKETLKFLFRWKQSIYQLLWKHAIIYFLIYVSFSCLYRYALTGKAKEFFENVAKYCSKNSGSINLAVMIGFFTSTAIQRLFTMQTAMPGAYRSTCFFMMSLKSNIPEGREYVATFARLQVLSWIFTFRAVCRPLRRMLPNLMSLQTAGLLTDEERRLLEDEEISGRDTPKALIVTEWMLLLLKECHEQGRFWFDQNLFRNVEELMNFKKKCSNILKFGSQNIPRALVQAVILAVYSFGVITLLGRALDDKDDDGYKSMIIDFFPLIPSLQFFVYLSWLAFGEAAINPFGDDADDIDITQFVNGHLQSAVRISLLYGREFSTELKDWRKNMFLNQAASFYS